MEILIQAQQRLDNETRSNPHTWQECVRQGRRQYAAERGLVQLARGRLLDQLGMLPHEELNVVLVDCRWVCVYGGGAGYLTSVRRWNIYSMRKMFAQQIPFSLFILFLLCAYSKKIELPTTYPVPCNWEGLHTLLH
jgi:hypothetical protein